MLAAALVIGALLVFWFLRRQSELVVFSVREGKTLVVRGQASGALINDFAKALEKTRRGEARVVKEADGAQVYASGDIDEFLEQRLRNILRLHPMAAFRSTGLPGDRSVLRVLGFVWLTWLFNSRGQ